MESNHAIIPIERPATRLVLLRNLSEISCYGSVIPSRNQLMVSVVPRWGVSQGLGKGLGIASTGAMPTQSRGHCARRSQRPLFLRRQQQTDKDRNNRDDDQPRRSRFGETAGAEDDCS